MYAKIIRIERIYMKYIRLFLFALFLVPASAMAASMPNNEFMVAAQLLSAAKNADIQQVQNLMNAGANINYVDSTGLSLVCTALMNNDIRAAQILQMYGADASQCDRQIKQYESRNKPTDSGGLFSGLSSAQTISLAAAGAAVVVGGLFLLTDWLDPGNENESGSGGGNRPGGGEGEGGNKPTSETSEIPVGPAYFTADGSISYSTGAYQNNLAQWNPSVGGIRAADFNYFRPGVETKPSDDEDSEDAPQITQTNYVTDGILLPLQNYLLIMHGYSSFANGYMGQYTFRNEKHEPQKMLNTAGGGKPIRTALVTANGINPSGSAARSVDGIVWANSTGVNTDTGIVDKYANYENPSGGNLGAEVSGLGGSALFDLSGSGTAMNPFATATESALAKIVAGWEAGGRTYGDMYGFAPNSQLAIYRTGNGKVWVDVENPTQGESVGTLTDSAAAGTAGRIEAGDTITFNGKTYAITTAIEDSDIMNPTITVNGTTYKLGAGSNVLRGKCTSSTAADCDDVSDIAIYMGTDGYYYINTTGGTTVDGVYVISDNNIYAQKVLKDADVKTFEAIYDMSKQYSIGTGSNVTNGLSSIAVAVLNPESRKVSYTNIGEIESFFALSGGTDKKNLFGALINAYYDKDSTDATSQGGYANSLFNGYNTNLPILIMPAGEFEYGRGDGKTMNVLDATFENYAPALYDSNLQHMFMTVVAVQHSKGTSAADSIGEYGNGVGSDYGPLYLSVWRDSNGTLEDTSDDIVYMSRKCGVAGLGINGVDPWCFAAAGPTAEMATASAAGAVAALKGAFPYMGSGDIFTLMALTADGPYLGTDSAGKAFTVDGLVSYLKAMYSLPPDYHADQLTGQDYLDAFAEVYGYGMINLERAMTPGNKIYFYDGNKIVSGNGNAYWRAASNTGFRASSVFSLSGKSISAPFFDVLESVNGEMSMPRVWENEFALGTTGKRGLYMGDVLGEFKTRSDAPQRVEFGNFGFSMSVSEKPYNDNLNGLDNMRLDYTSGNWNFAAGYQRHFTDGASRYDGMSNPILGLASNVITSDLAYNMGRWSFGARVFSGAITDETMLDNDPTISSQYLPARLGLMQGAQSDITWQGDKFGFTTSVGAAHENNTLLGAMSGGLLEMGNGDTMYVDSELRFSPYHDVTFKLRSTFARTMTDATGQFILGMSDIDSNAFAFGVDAGNFSFSVSQPLTISAGTLMYPYANYELVDLGNGKYDLSITDTHIENLDLHPDNREVRFTGTYRHSFGEFTDGAIGFIYRVHPNNTDEFGNESIFMMKMTHRLGI